MVVLFEIFFQLFPKFSVTIMNTVVSVLLETTTEIYSPISQTCICIVCYGCTMQKRNGLKKRKLH